jgi:hypothetical protein
MIERTRRQMMKARMFRKAMFSLLFSMLAIGMAVAETTTAPSATVVDQAVVDGRVTMARVFSAGPGWLVVHAQTADGKTGPVIGWSPVHGGENFDVTVVIDAAKATPVLSAMLHVDAGVMGVYEFPGADAPARAGDQMVNPPFKATTAPAAPVALPAVAVLDQAVINGRVTIARVFSAGPGWLVVHAQTADAKTGPVIGWSAVHAGENLGVTVAIDTAKATPVLSAMLHIDAGVVGVYEFPGADAPARAGDQMVNPPFKAMAN